MKVEVIYKTYEEVKIGDTVISEEAFLGADFENLIQGTVAGKGTPEELKEEFGDDIFDDAYDGEDDEEAINAYNWVMVSTPDTSAFCDDGGLILFNYNGDPSGVVVIKEIK